ncbi:hypothetical protein, partial [uncultured Rikenella sp.]|uniref:hypothetical protein n=1 Tax=uncultured Rikenella sp. TaxID=368003 RepID=UPI0025DA2534
RRRRASNWKVITAARHDANASAKRAPRPVDGRNCVSLWQTLSPFFVRALAEILFKAQDALNDFLLQRSRAVELCPASNCSFCSQKEPKKTLDGC